MTIKQYEPSMKTNLVQLMTAYFPEVNADIPQYIIETKLIELIESQIESHLLNAAIAFEKDIPVGFSIFQIDRPESDWCKREGWGFIREFYIVPEYRRRHFGTELAHYSVQKLKEMDAHGLYLTSDTSSMAESFWLSCGWAKTGAVASNHLPILEK